uniref:glutathione peroxidase n=1 Tax=Oncorhynchus tshawytscha TaxID=74940 RepID=A0AAZ3SWU3_ONCTS
QNSWYNVASSLLIQRYKFIPPQIGRNVKINCKLTLHMKKDGTIYNYNAKTLNGSRSVSLREYMGKTVLFVNVLNALHKEMKDYGFTILGFPSNQFGKQEPGDNHEILASLKHVRPGNGFVPNFLLFQRGDVNGDTEQGVYTFLKNSCPPVGDSFGNPTNRLFWEPLKMNDIKWNFEKFLVGPDGKPVMRWFPRVTVSEVRMDIIKYFNQLLSQSTQQNID